MRYIVDHFKKLWRLLADSLVQCQKESAALNYSLFDAKEWIHLHYTRLAAKEKIQSDKHPIAAVVVPTLTGVNKLFVSCPSTSHTQISWVRSNDFKEFNQWEYWRWCAIKESGFTFQPCYLWQTFLSHFGLPSPITYEPIIFPLSISSKAFFYIIKIALCFATPTVLCSIKASQSEVAVGNSPMEWHL